jgi:hypothetical protein
VSGAHFSIETIAKMKENLPFSIISPFSSIFHQLDQKRTYGIFWHRKFMREDGRLKHCRS